MEINLLIAYLVFSAIALVVILIMNLLNREDIKYMKDLYMRLRDEWTKTTTLCQKLETVALWYLERKNMTLEPTGSWVTPWLVVAKKDPNDISKLSDVWAAVYAHREELAEAIFDANLKALRTFSHEQEHDEEKTRKEIYEEKKALRRKK